MSAFERGWLDRERGKSISQCPFYSNSGEAIAWRNGWRACEQAEKDWNTPKEQ